MSAREDGSGAGCWCGAHPSDPHVQLAERAAAAVALDRLLRRDEEPAHRAQRGLLTALLAGNLPATQFAVRAEVLGVPVAEGALIGVAVRGRPRAVGDALRDTGQPALFGLVAEGSVAILLTLASGEDGHDQVTKLAAAVRTRVGPDVVIAAGRVVTAVHNARQTLTEALRVAAVAPGGGRPYARPADVGLPALMLSLRDDHDLQAYVERELGPLLSYTAENPGSDLLSTLRSYLDSGGNKSDAAAAAHMSRQALYDRLKRIGQLLDADLDSPRARAALHIAVLGHDAIRPGHS
ncbi:helix-turn-helix domain-containing protein [Actinocrispum sp. NPDC049592]|uniref:PucR family transcriptional regulator n=1 Tax=Actinocrispum sp. NPDC049592 TaxID=3154835 RepID=UPI003412680F